MLTGVVPGNHEWNRNCLVSEGFWGHWGSVKGVTVCSQVITLRSASSSNFVLLLCLLLNIINLCCSQSAGYKSHQTFESLSPFCLWLFLLWGMKYMSVICPPGADLRGAGVCRNESRVWRQEVVKSASGSRGRVKQATSPFCFIFLPREVKE